MPIDYTVAYAIGYYYGRCYPETSEATVCAEDLYYRNTLGFKDGLAKGRADFISIDLVDQALACKVVD